MRAGTGPPSSKGCTGCRFPAMRTASGPCDARPRQTRIAPVNPGARNGFRHVTPPGGPSDGRAWLLATLSARGGTGHRWSGPRTALGGACMGPAIGCAASKRPLSSYVSERCLARCDESVDLVSKPHVWPCAREGHNTYMRLLAADRWADGEERAVAALFRVADAAARGGDLDRLVELGELGERAVADWRNGAAR